MAEEPGDGGEVMTNVRETVGRRLRMARNVRGCTQAQVAELVQISLRSLARYEAGERLPNSDALFRLASILKHPVEWFFDP
jgi:repressor LexA